MGYTWQRLQGLEPCQHWQVLADLTGLSKPVKSWNGYWRFLANINPSRSNNIVFPPSKVVFESSNKHFLLSNTVSVSNMNLFPSSKVVFPPENMVFPVNNIVFLPSKNLPESNNIISPISKNFFPSNKTGSGSSKNPSG